MLQRVRRPDQRRSLRASTTNCSQQQIIGGFPLKKFYPELGNAALWCCTETTTRASIDAAAKEVA